MEEGMPRKLTPRSSLENLHLARTFTMTTA
jgi:hypothetical protein